MHLEWTCTGYVPLGRPEKTTARSAGGARAAAAAAGEAVGLAEGEADAAAGDSAGKEAEVGEVEHDAAAASDSAARPIVSAERSSAARHMQPSLVAAGGE